MENIILHLDHIHYLQMMIKYTGKIHEVRRQRWPSKNLVFQLQNKREYDTNLISLQFHVWASCQCMSVEADVLLPLDS
jgi:hypothetical protein